MADFGGLDYFPEDDYDPSSGEYTSAFNFEPTFTNTFWLDAAQTIQVTVSSFTPDAVGPAFDALEKIVGLAEKGVFEPGFDENNPSAFPTMPDEFDTGGKSIRGPFIDDEAVQNFLKKSGLRGVAVVYYDEQNDEFWIDTCTSGDCN